MPREPISIASSVKMAARVPAVPRRSCRHYRPADGRSWPECPSDRVDFIFKFAPDAGRKKASVPVFQCLYSLYMGLLRKARISPSISVAHSWKRRRPRRRSCGGHLEFIGSGHLGADYKMSRMCILPANYVNAPPYRKPKKFIGVVAGYKLRTIIGWPCSLKALHLHIIRRHELPLLSLPSIKIAALYVFYLKSPEHCKTFIWCKICVCITTSITNRTG